MTRTTRIVSVLLLAVLPATAFAKEMPRGPQYFHPPTQSTLPHGKFGALVRQGRRIFMDTPRYAARYAGDGLSCQSCHLDAGRMPNAMPLWGAAGEYPKYQARTQQVVTLGERMQQCFIASLHGYAPPRDSETLLALEAYASWLSTGAPQRTVLRGAGLPEMPRTGHAPDSIAGRRTYEDHCATCHGDGGGIRNPKGGYAVPPLWGADAFPHGVGLGRQSILSRFILANMPQDQPGTLTPQQAKNVAAWIRIQWREPNPRKGLLGWLP